MSIADIKVISLDVFRTLVAVDGVYEYVWSKFLGNKYTKDSAKRNWDRATEIFLNELGRAAQETEHFKNTRTVIQESYAQLFKEIKLDFNPAVAASILMEGHRIGAYYDDVRPFLEKVGMNHRICLSTDCDKEMLGNLNALYPFDNIFISEQLKAYKANPKFFTQVISHYGVKPENILHIGDSQSDVVTPKMLGMLTCWLNRDGGKWDNRVKPDFEVASLRDVVALLK
jgi:FMN hydrolase / 5-amino-6-(5-phospho-D-ribitylamino)uracil phosphatase